MEFDWRQLVLFAQEAGEGAANGGPEAVGNPFSFFLVPILLTFAVFYFLILLPERKRTRKKEDQLKALKKNDKVLTIGGIIGIVANVKQDEEEITLKIDSDKDVKVRITRSSIAKVLTSKQETRNKDEG